MTLPSRESRRLAWTRDALADPAAALERASVDASFRSYWRCQSGGRTWIVMDAPPGKEDIRPWLDIASRLNAAGLHAPEIRASDADEGFVLMADLGTRLYLPELDDARVDALYGQALDALLVMQSRVPSEDLPAYDDARLIAEMELMPEWLLQRHLGLTPECDGWDEIELAFRVLANSARHQPQAFVHRDFHSRNLMVTEHNSPGILDFQDAVRGPLTYDLVSLLRDAYVVWPEERVYGWVEDYRKKLEHSGLTHVDAGTFKRAFDLMGLQRHIKILGIFCRLWYRDGKAGYLGDLPLVWRYVREVGRRYSDIAPLVGLIERAIGDRDLTQPRA
jgi:N-acetylmuramate 1-kinase